MKDDTMKDISYKPGDQVTISTSWLEADPDCPLIVGIQEVCEPGDFRMKGEVPITYGDDIYYVPEMYVRMFSER